MPAFMLPVCGLALLIVGMIVAKIYNLPEGNLAVEVIEEVDEVLLHVPPHTIHIGVPAPIVPEPAAPALEIAETAVKAAP